MWLVNLYKRIFAQNTALWSRGKTAAGVHREKGMKESVKKMKMKTDSTAFLMISV